MASEGRGGGGAVRTGTEGAVLARPPASHAAGPGDSPLHEK